MRVAVDIGGTFTDIVVQSPAGVLHESKIATTPDDPSRAVVAGLEALLRELALAPQLITEVLHGTTVGSNTILQRTGARTGLMIIAAWSPATPRNDPADRVNASEIAALSARSEAAGSARAAAAWEWTMPLIKKHVPGCTKSSNPSR